MAEITAHDDHLDVESSFDLGRLLERLPEKMRCSIEAVKIDGLSVAEAALRHLGIRCQGQCSSRTEGVGAIDCPDNRKVTYELIGILSVEPMDRHLVGSVASAERDFTGP